MNDKFFKEYSNLNIKQKEAVDSIDGPVMVIAGPGTGKTTILTLRIANILLKTDTPPSGILALTFTEAGVKAMRQKLKNIIGDKSYEVPIYTFHGFASSTLGEFSDHFPHLRKSEQITEIESENIIRNILKDKRFSILRPLGDPDYYISKIISSISYSKQEAWTPSMVRDYAENELRNIDNNEDLISTRGNTKGQLKAEAKKRIEKCEKTILFSEVYELYEKIKKEEHKTDFDDLIFELLLGIKNDELLRQLLQEKYLYILVDEHQDTNDSQNLIVKYLADYFDNPNLFVVGDEKQAIFRFQGASIENFLKFQHTWKNMQVISLEDNYRSNQKILDGSFEMIEKNYEDGEFPELRIKLKSQKEELEHINIYSATDILSEESFIIEKIKSIQKKDGESKIAIITRKNYQVGKIFDLLQKEGIEATAERGADVFNHPIGNAFFILIEYLNDISRLELLADTISLGLWELSFTDKIKILNHIKTEDNASIQKLLPNLEKIIPNINEYGVIDYLIKVGEVSGLTRKAMSDPLSMEVWREIISISKNIASNKNIEDTKKIIEELILYKKTAEKKSLKIKSGKINTNILILTAHSSKGLEFDYVFIPYATEESWITKSKGNYFILPKDRIDTDYIKDERRLFYVALTRAMKEVIITNHEMDLKSKVVTPLRFIDEIDEKSRLIKKIPNTTKQDKSFEMKTTLEKEKIEYAKRQILEKGISVTALNHFISCKNKFYYKSILRIPEPPSALSEKGNAMHEAMSNVWISKEKDLNKIGAIIKNSAKTYFKKSLLPKYEKEVILKEIEIDSPIIAKSLQDHFSTEGIAKTEEWVSGIYTRKIGNEDIDIRLHGKLDVILENNKNILVFDYKTKLAMSVNAIKGLTESEDGSYWRQLIFYQILLKRDKKWSATNKEIIPSLVFIKPSKKINNPCPIVQLPVTEHDEKEIFNQIDLLLESIWSGEILKEKCNDSECRYCKFDT